MNVAWDGGVHAFVLDTVTATDARRQGIGRRLVEPGAAAARAAGYEWLHADFEEGLGPFYLGACSFTPTPAGVVEL